MPHRHYPDHDPEDGHLYALEQLELHRVLATEHNARLTSLALDYDAHGNAFVGTIDIRAPAATADGLTATIEQTAPPCHLASYVMARDHVEGDMPTATVEVECVVHVDDLPGTHPTTYSRATAAVDAMLASELHPGETEVVVTDTVSGERYEVVETTDHELQYTADSNAIWTSGDGFTAAEQFADAVADVDEDAIIAELEGECADTESPDEQSTDAEQCPACASTNTVGFSTGDRVCRACNHNWEP